MRRLCSRGLLIVALASPFIAYGSGAHAGPVELVPTTVCARPMIPVDRLQDLADDLGPYCATVPMPASDLPLPF